MLKPLFTLLFLCVAGTALAGPPPLTLTLPDPGTYSLWIQSVDGTVSVLPFSVSEKQTVKVTQEMETGDHLYVLDSHTGAVATKDISLGLDSKPLPLQIKLTDFHVISLSAPPSPAGEPSAPVAAPDTQTNTQSGTPLTRLLTGLVSLALAGGVLWLLVHLIRTRGEPLLHLARRAGVEVPDPAPVAAQEAAPNVIYTPTPRVPEMVPEETGLVPAAAARPARGLEVSLNGMAALVGIQGLVAGSTFALTEGDVIIGRDGECGIVLAENTVSRRHARLYRDGQGQFSLTDLGSANGIQVNGMRVQRAILSSDDEIKIGDNYFRFQAAKEH